ncbi:MAG: ATP-dependent Clp protease proteolytic subunit [Pseudomonadota bacterium]
MSEKEKEKSPEDKNLSDILFKSRTIFITGTIDDKIATQASQQLIALASKGDEPINLYISSPGGHVESGDMVHDMIKFIRPTVRTIGTGWVASAGALIFVGAEKENRFCLPNTRFLLHQPAGGVGGKAVEIEIQARQIQIMKERFENLFAKATGQTPERIREDTKRDFWMTTEEALEYGLLGSVISSIDQLPTE